MVRRWGAQPFGRCVEPAQQLAARGFPVSSRLAREPRGPATSAGAAPAADAIASWRCSRQEAGGRATPGAGPIWRWTLGKLRAGPDAFYKGEIAEEIVRAVRAAGGVMTAEDLAGYATDRADAAGDRLPRAARAVDAAAVVGRRRADRDAGHPGGALPAGTDARRASARQRGAAARAGRGVQARLRRSGALPGRHRLRRRRRART